MRKIISLCTVLGIFTLSTSYALQLNTTIGSDILALKDPGITIKYKIYWAEPYKQYKSIESEINDLPVLNFKTFIDMFNDESKAIVPIDSPLGEPSVVSFGYVEQANSTFPASCQLIKVKPVTNVVITKEGCLVS